MKPVPRTIAFIAVLITPVVWPVVVLWVAVRISATLCINLLKRYS